MKCLLTRQGCYNNETFVYLAVLNWYSRAWVTVRFYLYMY